MKINSVLTAPSFVLLSGFSTAHKTSALKNKASLVKEHTNNLAEKTNLLTGETVIIESVKSQINTMGVCVIFTPPVYTNFQGILWWK